MALTRRGVESLTWQATGSVVEVEAIDVEDGLHEKKQGPRLAATAPRPFAEATRRDDGNKLVDAATRRSAQVGFKRRHEILELLFGWGRWGTPAAARLGRGFLVFL